MAATVTPAVINRRIKEKAKKIERLNADLKAAREAKAELMAELKKSGSPAGKKAKAKTRSR